MGRWPRVKCSLIKSGLARFGLLFILVFLPLVLAACTALPLSEPAPRFEQAHIARDHAASDTEIACAVTQPFQDQPPDDPHADPFAFGNWHINADRTLWVQIPPSGVWHTGGEKAIWIRPAGTTLRISGQRLDAEAEPLVVNQPCCYPTGFEVNALHFPTAGCWEVVASAGEDELRFVIEVKDSQGKPGRSLGIAP